MSIEPCHDRKYIFILILESRKHDVEKISTTKFEQIE